MNFVNTENSNTERILCSGIRRKAKHKLKGPEINYFSSLSKLKEKQNNKHKIIKRTNACLRFEVSTRKRIVTRQDG